MKRLAQLKKEFYAQLWMPLIFVALLLTMAWIYPGVFKIIFWLLAMYAFLTPLVNYASPRRKIGLLLAGYVLFFLIWFFNVDSLARFQEIIIARNTAIMESSGEQNFTTSLTTGLEFLRRSRKLELIALILSVPEFIWPTRLQLVIIFVLAGGMGFLRYRMLHSILARCSNRTFELFAFSLTHFGAQLARFVRCQLVQLLVWTLLWALAMLLLRFDHVFVLAVAMGFASMTPSIGLWIGAALPFLFIQPDQSMYFQIVGVVIAFAVLWLLHHAFLAGHEKKVLPSYNRRYLTLIILMGYYVLGLEGLLLVGPIAIIGFLLAETFVKALPLLRLAWPERALFLKPDAG